MNILPIVKTKNSHPRRFPHRGQLPEGSHYTLTWGISDDFGGMTTAALERSSAFARLDNRRVEILTLSPQLKDRDRERELRADGRIDRRVKVRNLWKELTSWSDRKLRRMVGTVDPDPAVADDVLTRTGCEWSEIRRDSDGRLLQADRYHDRGHLLIVDRQDMKKRGRRGGRRITLFDREQNPIAQWSTAREFYLAWLDAVIGTKPSYLICDSAFVGNFIHQYRRDNVILCQVNHNHHLADANDEVFGALAEDKFGYLSHLDGFDVVATLTDEQRTDMERLELSAGKLRTVSNLTEDLHGDPVRPRHRGHGAMIARLVPQKRVEDAINAIATVAAEDSAVTLDVYGEGEDREMLTDLIESRGIAESVILHGHTAGAKSNFHSRSFSLLTSRFEGQGLVVLESMSAGCVPICYAVDYGPADIIGHGVNGFLVPNGDAGALANAISHFLSLSEAAVREMRRNAVARASDYFERPIVARWAQVLAEQEFAPIVRLDGVFAELREAVVDADKFTITSKLSGIGEIAPERAYVSWKSRTGRFYGRVRADTSGGVVTAELPLSRLGHITEEYIDFSVDLIVGRGFSRVRISGVDDAIANRPEAPQLYTTKHGNLRGRSVLPRTAPDNGRVDLTSTPSS